MRLSRLEATSIFTSGGWVKHCGVRSYNIICKHSTIADDQTLGSVKWLIYELMSITKRVMLILGSIWYVRDKTIKMGFVATVLTVRRV